MASKLLDDDIQLLNTGGQLWTEVYYQEGFYREVAISAEREHSKSHSAATKVCGIRVSVSRCLLPPAPP